jgi:hypothetical protein
MIPELKYARLGSTSDAGGVHARLRYGTAILLNLESVSRCFPRPANQ